ncbi:MAG: hypothetical protein V3W20_04180 [Candidatus Neomarinimicrobiota bacterium]
MNRARKNIYTLPKVRRTPSENAFGKENVIMRVLSGKIEQLLTDEKKID